MSHASRHFQPPFCPNRTCAHHLETRGFRWIRFGTYRRRNPPHVVQRFRCRSCGVTFAGQSYETSYWLKRPELLEPLFLGALGCSGYRQLGRELGCSPDTVRRHVERLGRHCQLLHERLRPRGPLSEAVVLDGFESWEYSQYHPYHLNLVVGAGSRYSYGIGEAELRRKGRMRADQRRRRAELERLRGRADPKAVELSVAALLEDVVAEGSSAVVRSDEHRAYPRGIARLRGRRIRHETTSSRVPRTPQNPLAAVNEADGSLRHASANHKRETIAASKRRQGALYRALTWQAWKNYVKPVNMAKRTRTPAMRLGLLSRPLTVAEILKGRLFADRVGLSEMGRRFYEARVVTRALEVNRVHALRYAY